MTEKIEGAQYKIIKENDYFPVGRIVTLIEDDDSNQPRFSDGQSSKWIYMGNVELLNNTDSDKITEIKVGTVYTDCDDDNHQLQEDGTLVSYNHLHNRIHWGSDFSVKELCDEYPPRPATEAETAEFNKKKLKYQLEHLEKGEVYVVQDDGITDEWIIRFDDMEGRKVYGNAVSPHGGYTDKTSALSNVTAIRPATTDEIDKLEAAEREHDDLPEQLPKLKVGDRIKIKDVADPSWGNWVSNMEKYLGKVLTVSRVYGRDNNKYLVKENEWTWEDWMIEGLADEQSEPEFDNPELTVGEVYTDDDDWTFRYFKNDDEYEGILKHSVYGNWLASLHEGLHENDNWPFNSYRKATPAEIAKLEAAEKENGCEYHKTVAQEFIVGNSYNIWMNGNSHLITVTDVADNFVSFTVNTDFGEVTLGKKLSELQFDKVIALDD